MLFNRKFEQLIKDDFRNVQRIVSEAGDVKYVAGRDSNGHSDFVSSLVMNIQAVRDNPINATMPSTFQSFSAFGTRYSRF